MECLIAASTELTVTECDREETCGIRWQFTRVFGAVGCHLMLMVSTSTTGMLKAEAERRDPASRTLAMGEVRGETPPSRSISATAQAILSSCIDSPAPMKTPQVRVCECVCVNMSSSLCVHVHERVVVAIACLVAPPTAEERPDEEAVRPEAPFDLPQSLGQLVHLKGRVRGELEKN